MWIFIHATILKKNKRQTFEMMNHKDKYLSW